MSSFVLKCVLLQLLIALCCVQSQNLFYASPYGSDTNNTCTNLNQPCQTIQHAFDQIVSGAKNNTISLLQGTFTLTAPITFSTSYIGLSVESNQASVIIDGQGKFACFNIKSIESEIFIGQMQINNCYSETDGAAVTVSKTTVNLRAVTISKSKAARGAAVFVTGGANVAIVDSTLAGNTAAQSGGALFVDAGDVSMQNTGFYQNQAANGGAIAVDGDSEVSITMIRGTIVQNSASQSGGGIFLSSNKTVVLFVNTTIFENTAASGGGVACYASSVDVNDQFTNVTINQNNATTNQNVLCGGCGNCGACDACVSGACNLGSAAGGCQCYSDPVRGFWGGANCSNCTESDTLGHWGGDMCTTCANDADRGFWVGDKCLDCKKSWVGKNCDYQKFPIVVIIIVSSVCIGIVIAGYIIGFPLFRIKKESSGYSPIYD